MQTHHHIEKRPPRNPIFERLTIRYYYQDGADFYLFETPLEARGEVECAHPLECHYPGGVQHDYDIAGAIDARDWFMKVWCPSNNILPQIVPSED